MEHYKEMINKALLSEPDIDDPASLSKLAAKVDSLSYPALMLQAEAEKKLAEANDSLRKAQASLPNMNAKSATERQALWEAENSELLKQVEIYSAEVKYWRQVGVAVANKTDVLQTILQNVSTQIKAGIWANSQA